MRAHLALVLLTLAASCAGLTPNPAAQNKCGNRCDSMTCPSAFRCEVGADCVPRCQPEVVPKP